MTASPAPADGVDPRYLAFRLSVLPEVTSHAVDDQGHLVRLAGRMTPPGASPAREVVPAFLRIHRNLYPAAPRTAYRVEWTTAVEEGTEVAVRQEVDGFASEELIRGVVNAEGELILLEGLVLHGTEGGGEGLTGRPLDEAEAYRLAIAAAFRGPGEPPNLDRFEERAATRLVDRNLRRVWRVELVRRLGSRPLRHTVVLDAVTGAVLRRNMEDVGHLLGMDDRPPVTPSDSAKVLTLLGCEPADPPLGDFTTQQGVAEWLQTRLTWGHEPGPPSLARFTATANIEGGDYGSISRFGVDVPSRHRRVRLHFPSLDKVTTFKLRWGLTDARTVTFTAPQDGSRPPCVDVSVTVYLDDHPYWPPTSGAPQIRLHVLTKDATGTIDRVELLPGAFLELAAEPRLLAGGSVPDRFMAGTSYGLWQPVVNNGCELRVTGSVSQRGVTYTACRDGNPSLCAEMWCDLASEVPDDTAEIAGSLPAGSYATYRLCTMFLPPASAATEGTWTLTGSFEDLSKQPETLPFYVENGLLPDVSFAYDQAFPAVATEGGTRVEWISANQPFKLSIPVRSSTEPAADVPLQLWARARMPGAPPTIEPWVLLGETVVEALATTTTMVDLDDLVVGIPLVTATGFNWSILDLKVVLNPDQSVPESNYDNNTAELLDFIPVALEDMGELGDALLAHWEGFNDLDLELPLGEWAVWWEVVPSHGKLSFYYDWTSNENNPFLHWHDTHRHPIGGVMIRYRRIQTTDVTPYLIAGAWWGHEPRYVQYVDLPPDLGGSDVNKHFVSAGEDYQWHTVVWRQTFHQPFGDFEENPIISIPMGAPDAPGDPFTHLYLAPDTGCATDLAGDCIVGLVTELDFVAFWEDEGGGQSPPWDATPRRVLYDQPGIGWTELSRVGPGIALNLAVEVEVTVHYEESVPASLVQVLRTDPGSPGVQMTPSTPDPAAGFGRRIFPIGQWSPSLPGETTFRVTLFTADSNTNNNIRFFTVHVGQCIPPVDLP